MSVLRLLRSILVGLSKGLVWATALVVALVAFDFYLGVTYRAAGPVWSNIDLYPYDGFRNTIKTGPLGFWQRDFDFENPPKKEANEIRVIVIGGSGAQGQGVDLIEQTYHPQLQSRLNNRFAARGWRVRVLNMAAGGSQTYQNFILLNIHGHKVDPDIIISYAGRNDLIIPFYMGDDSYWFFSEVNYYVSLTDNVVRSDEPGLIKTLSRLLPNIYAHTQFAFYVKDLLYRETYHQLVKLRYRSIRGFDELVPGRIIQNINTIRKIALPLQVHALKSIKRDFDGVPIVLAWSAVHRNEMPDLGLSDEIYWQMFDDEIRQLQGYYNEDWLFLNVDAMLADKKDEPFIGCSCP